MEAQVPNSLSFPVEVRSLPQRDEVKGCVRDDPVDTDHLKQVFPQIPNKRTVNEKVTIKLWFGETHNAD